MKKLLLLLLVVLAPCASAGRIFDADAANFLQSTTVVASERIPFTVGLWVKRQASGPTYQVSYDLTSSGAYVTYDEGGPGSFERYFPQGGGTAVPDISGGPYAYGVWELWTVVIDSTEGWIYRDGMLVGDKDGQTYTGLVPTMVQMLLGKDLAGTAPFYGKIAHPFIFKRALSGGEIASLVTADPTTLTSTGRAFYTPLVTASLANLWTPGGGDSFGDWVENGTVAWDTDNPYSSPPATSVPVIQHYMNQQQ